MFNVIGLVPVKAVEPDIVKFINEEPNVYTSLLPTAAPLLIHSVTAPVAAVPIKPLKFEVTTALSNASAILIVIAPEPVPVMVVAALSVNGVDVAAPTTNVPVPVLVN